MNKTIRFLLVLALVVGVVVAAGGAAAWASPAAKAPEAVSAKANPALPAARSSLGTVTGENCNGVKVKDADTEGVCGIATVTTQFGSSVFANVSGGGDFGFRSGILSLFFDSGSALICFAAPQNGQIFFQLPNSFDWTPIATTISNGRACAVVSQNGQYAFGQ